MRFRMRFRTYTAPGAVVRRPTVRRRLSAATVAGLLTAMLVPATGSADVRPATPATFGSVLASAQPGDVVELAPGSYGRFEGASKAGMVTIRSAASGAATMSVRFNAARNLRLEGLTIPELLIAGSSNSIVVAGSTFTGGAVVNAEQMVNANVVFDGNVHPNVNVCGSCYEGRLEVVRHGPGPSGVTVMNSRFGPGGNADGVQIADADGVQVLNNEFVGIKVVSGVHTDSLQLLDTRNTVIRGNYFHDFEVGIMAPDGGSNEVITDNVLVGDGSYAPAVQLGSHRGTQFVHNTLRNINVHMDRKSENPGNPSRDGVIRDNVFVNGTIGGYSHDPSYCANCTFTTNLFNSAGRAEGANAIVGNPLFAGGANPTTWSGYALAAGSPGKGRATDGGDVGIRLSARASSDPPPAPAAPAPATPPTRRVRRRAAKLALDSHVTFRALRRGLKVRVTARRAMRLQLRLARKGAKRALAVNTVRMKRGTKTFHLRPAARRLGRPQPQTLVLRVKAKPRSGRAFVLRRVIHVRVGR
jgi:Right handed beta helix region